MVGKRPGARNCAGGSGEGMGRRIPRIVSLSGGEEPYREALETAGTALRAGGIALLPAEGLYGLHADAFRTEALERLNRLKAAPPGRPYVLLAGSIEQAEKFVREWPGRAAEIADAYWPGRVTLVLPAAQVVPGALAPDGRVALRCPGARMLRDLALLIDGALVSTSANTAGAPPPRALPEVEEAILAGCDVAVDAGPLSGEASAIVRPETDGRVTVLRGRLPRAGC